MGMNEMPSNMQTSIAKHTYFDLSRVSPLLFLYLLKECYDYGTCKAGVKFRALQQHLHLILLNNSHVGPATFIARCLFLMPVFELDRDGLSHLVLSALRRFLKLRYNSKDAQNAKIYAAEFFLVFVGGNEVSDEGILSKIVQIFDVNLVNIEKALSYFSMKRYSKAIKAKEVVEKCIFKLLESQSYMTAVDLLIQFSIREFGDSFLHKLMNHQQYKAADKWAAFMGRETLCLLVKAYVERKLLQPAFDVIKKYKLHQEFPELYLQSKESSLKKLAEKGVWEIAEARANGDGHLLEYLVYLAMEAGYLEKVEELCDRYSLEGFMNFNEIEGNLLKSRHLQLNELFIENVIWVDEVHSLRNATCYIEESKVVGIDCEWKPNYEKGSRPNKVSIMQIASGKKVYIFDLIKLHNDAPYVLDECFSRILHSKSLLKLGYNFQCDAKQLAHSYQDLSCFKHFDMLLDVQNVFKEPRGGLSGLAEKILGTGLNKTRRNSNWEQRPLSQYQQEYAALDAAVLLHIFRHVRSHTYPNGASNGHAKIEWKSHIIARMEVAEMRKKEGKALNLE